MVERPRGAGIMVDVALLLLFEAFTTLFISELRSKNRN